MNDYAEIWNTHSNAPALVLLSNGEVVDLSGTTRVTVNCGGSPVVIVDSSTSPTAFDWATTVEYPAGSGTNVNALHLKFGAEGLDVGQYPDCELTIYDAAHPNGLVFTSELKLKVREQHA